MLSLVIAPDPIYKTVCTPVAVVDDRIRSILGAMVSMLHTHQALGIGAPMVGITERLVVAEMENGTRYQMVNPIITTRSEQTNTMEESSITFLGISAPVTRPAEVTVAYLDEHGAQQTVHATGLLATCLQHEIDYLDGKTILDYQPPVKRDMLRRKMEKNKRFAAAHVHGPHCNH